MENILISDGRWLDGATWERLQGRVHAGVRRARARHEAVLISVTGEVDHAADPSAIVAASRGSEEPWFCLEQPAREGLALAAIGEVLRLEATGPDRLTELAGRWRSLVAAALADDVAQAPGSGLSAVGGCAFAPDGGQSPTWSGFAAGSLLVPEVTLSRRDGRTWITVNALAGPQTDEREIMAGIARRLTSLRSAPLPLFDPAPVGDYRVLSPMPPAHYEEAVARAVQRIGAGELRKVVLAREVDVHAPRAHDPAAVLGVLRDAFPTSFVYAVGRGDATFLGATPELLIRRQGRRASTVALAGSTRRSADPAVDRHLAEQLLRSDKDREENAIVADRITRTLAPRSVWTRVAEEPVVVTVANIQHLAMPIRAQLTESTDALTLAGLLHPTPAVGAEPAEALGTIPALEGIDRGWYAGAVGWTDAAGDGEFCVALRGALLRGAHARCYAGCGIVADSDPAAELAETEVKLQVMLPVLAG